MLLARSRLREYSENSQPEADPSRISSGHNPMKYCEPSIGREELAD